MGIYAKDVLTAGSQSTLLKTIKGSGTLSVDELRQGGATRITRIEIENTGSAGAIGVEEFTWTSNPQFSPSAVAVDIHYTRPAASTAGTQITVDGKAYACTPLPTGVGCVARAVSAFPFANTIMSVVNADGTRESITFNAFGGQPVYAYSGSPVARTGTPGEPGKPAAVPRNTQEVILFYRRDDDNYTGWGVHLFPQDPATPEWTLWAQPHPFEGVDPVWGAYFRIALPGKENPKYSANPPTLDAFPNRLGFIIHKGDIKDPGPDQTIEIADSGTSVFVVSGVNDVSSVPPDGGTTVRIGGAAAHWVNQGTLLWTPPAGVIKVELLYSPDASINVGLQGITGNYETIPLATGTNPQPAFNKQLHALKAWALPATATAKAKDLARGQLIALGRNAKNETVIGTLVQTAGALDAIYATDAYGKALGVSYNAGVPSLAVWAPTALKTPGVTVNVYDANGTKIESKPMTLDEASGVWSVAGTAAWNRNFYTISLQVYSYATNSIVTNEVTDPYSVSLSTNSVRSQFVDLNDVELKPAGWDDPNWNDPNVLRPIAAPEDIVLYELHVRDFSIADGTVPKPANADDPDHRGKFTAFDRGIVGETDGIKHLEKLADAGLTHVHILPAFDFATVRENAADQVNLDDPVSKLCAANSAAASLCITDAGKTIRKAMEDAVAAKQLDRPQQITECYSTKPDGTNPARHRVREFRTMVKGLRDTGLRTVMDVVYNHTNASGQNGRAVLDRLVPGYYHRRDITSGNVEKNSCCDDTATEFKMMEKLMIDTGVMWVRDYKITGFRFDIMAFHSLDSMKKFQDAVKAVDPTVYIYGEGWNFGSVKDDARFVTARQANLGGTGIGSFSDRIRDPIRGGGPFDSGAQHVQNQGFISGWFYAPNSANTGSTAERDALIKDSDNIRAWLAGGLAGYRFQSAAGTVTTGAAVDYRGQPSGYTQDPQEAINYASKHDNETIWDISQYKHATGTAIEERVRADNVATSVIMLAQGVPFIHAGTELLRSKSMDRNSYDSGDWFNAIDWRTTPDVGTSNWNKGLPRAADNSASYDQIRNVILDVTAVQDQAARDAAFANFTELLELRKSSLLFRLRTKAQIDQRVRFYNTGPFQIPGVIAKGIDGCAETNFAPEDAALMVIFNASDDPRTLQLSTGETWALHPVLQDGVNDDPVVKTASHGANGFFVPARTTAVFVRTAPAQTTCSPYPVDMFVRGSFNNWANPPPVNYKLQFLGGTTLAVSAPVGTTGNHEFKIADAGWSPATNCGVGPNGLSDVRLGVPITLTCADGTGNLRMNAPSTGNYTFALNAASTANPVLTVSKTPAFSVPIYVRGVGTDWSDPPTAVQRMTPAADANLYRAVLNVATAGADADGGFKIADAGWTAGTNCGSSTPLTIGQPLTLACTSPGNDNIGVTWPSTGLYLFALDTTNPAAPQLTVEKVPVNVPVFVRGIGGDWTDAAANQMSYFGGGIWSLNKAVAATANEFKVASSDWATVDCGAGAAGDTVTVGTPLAIGCNSGNGNLKLTPAREGTYTFKYRRDTPTAGEVTVSGP